MEKFCIIYLIIIRRGFFLIHKVDLEICDDCLQDYHSKLEFAYEVKAYEVKAAHKLICQSSNFMLWKTEAIQNLNIVLLF